MSFVGLSTSGTGSSSMPRGPSNSSLFKTDLDCSESMEIDIEDFLFSELFNGSESPEVKYEAGVADLASYDQVRPMLESDAAFKPRYPQTTSDGADASSTDSKGAPQFNFTVDCESASDDDSDFLQFGFDFPAPQNETSSKPPSPQEIPPKPISIYTSTSSLQANGSTIPPSPFKVSSYTVPALNALSTTLSLDMNSHEVSGQLYNLVSAIEFSRNNSVAPSRNQTAPGSPTSLLKPCSTFRSISLASLPIEEAPLTQGQMDVLQRRRNSLNCEALPFLPSATADIAAAAAAVAPVVAASTPVPVYIHSDAMWSGGNVAQMNGDTPVIPSDNYLLTSVPAAQSANPMFVPRRRNPSKLEINTKPAAQYRSTAAPLTTASVVSSSSSTLSSISPLSFNGPIPISSTSVSPHSAKQKLSKTPRTSHAAGYSHVYKCPIAGCTQSFHKQMNLTSHIKTHKSSKIFTCPEAECGATFRRSHDLRRHYLSMHNETGKQFNCLNCPKQFARLDALKRHVSRKGNKCFMDLGEEGCMQRLAMLVKEDMIKRGVPLDSLALHCALLGSSNSISPTSGEPASGGGGGSVTRTELVLNTVARKRSRKSGADGVLTVAALGGLQSPDGDKGSMESLNSYAGDMAPSAGLVAHQHLFGEKLDGRDEGDQLNSLAEALNMNYNHTSSSSVALALS
ncbi:hypothetical protein BJ741DRAFT_364201 [Chytriomyces cf. hyalinus JEL632]|nr:hypothetical protein BJ741DRAFT_364201 [Chytriomyces cf. hyalinus JEL632]